MRISAITNLNLVDIDCERRILSVVEKGGRVQPYPISKQGLASISDYLEMLITLEALPDLLNSRKGPTTAQQKKQALNEIPLSA